MSVRLLVIYTLVLFSCESGINSNQVRGNSYFDLEHLLEEQQNLLDSLSPELIKIAFLSGQPDTVRFSPDSTDWVRELDIFFELDLNSPVLRDQYSISEYDSVGGHKITIYERKDQKKDGVQFLKMVEKERDILIIEGVYHEKSLLYDTYRRLQLQMAKDNGINKISNYSVIGRQKMIFQDTVRYKIVGKIVY